jgi:TRAP-type uncharacterized transport system substrate-binding protein
VHGSLHNQGIKSLADFAKLKGKRVGLGATGSINQYLFARGLQNAGYRMAPKIGSLREAVRTPPHGHPASGPLPPGHA